MVFIVYVKDTNTGSDGPFSEKTLLGDRTDWQEA